MAGNPITGTDWMALAQLLRVEREQLAVWVHDIATNADDAFLDAVNDNAEGIQGLGVASALVDGVATYSRQLAGNLAAG